MSKRSRAKARAQASLPFFQRTSYFEKFAAAVPSRTHQAPRPVVRQSIPTPPPQRAKLAPPAPLPELVSEERFLQELQDSLAAGRTGFTQESLAALLAQQEGSLPTYRAFKGGVIHV